MQFVPAFSSSRGASRRVVWEVHRGAQDDKRVMLVAMKLRTQIFLLAFSLGASGTVHAQIDRITGKVWATRSPVLARHGMVCTSVPAATQVGLDILKKGGNAVDAAIAANATLGLMEPVSNGIGGDLFAIVYSAKEHKLYGLNGSGRSPRGLSYEQMKSELAKLHRDTIPPTGMLPIRVVAASRTTLPPELPARDASLFLIPSAWARISSSLMPSAVESHLRKSRHSALSRVFISFSTSIFWPGLKSGTSATSITRLNCSSAGVGF